MKSCTVWWSIAPWIVRACRPTRRTLPLGFGRQALPRPTAVRLGSVVVLERRHRIVGEPRIDHVVLLVEFAPAGMPLVGTLAHVEALLVLSVRNRKLVDEKRTKRHGMRRRKIRIPKGSTGDGV